MVVVVGIDPDVHSTAIARVVDGVPEEYQVCRTPKTVKGLDAVLAQVAVILTHLPGMTRDADLAVVEGQEIYLGRTPNPKSILMLGQVAGACLASCTAKAMLFPSPKAWKGDVPKRIHQARLCDRLKWSYTTRGSGNNAYCIPVKHLGTKNVSDWKHVMDAIGLALWGGDQISLSPSAFNVRS